ncbi:MAG: hypothetical protein WAN34_01660 [Acidimicrobiia bacterium]
MDGSSDIETRHGLVKRRVLYGQIAAGVAVVASALGNAGRSAGWLTSSWSLLVGLIAAVGFLLLGGALVSAWRFNERLSTDQRLKLSDEFTSFLDDQATRRAALATLAAAGIIAALPSAAQWSGGIVAASLFCLGSVTLAVSRLLSDR